MKTRSLVIVVLCLLVMISTVPPSTAHGLQSPATFQPSSLNELTVPIGDASSSAASYSAPASPSSFPCLFAGWTTVYYETFDSVTAPVLPPGWSTSPISGTLGIWQTNAGTVHPSGSPATSPPNLVYFNSYYAPAGNTARLRRTTALDLRHYKNVFLCLRWYRDSGFSGSNDRVQAQVSTNGGSSWTDVGIPKARYYASNGWWATGIGITSLAAGHPSVYLGFLGISEYGNDIHLDDVQVTAVPSIYLPLMVR